MAGSNRATGARHRSPDLDDALAFRVHRTNRLLRTHLSRLLHLVAPDVTPEQWFVLARIGHRGPVRQIDLAEPVLGDPPNVSRLVDALVARRYAERSPDPADRRSWLVSLTRQGRALTDRILEHAADERREVFAGFTDAELDALAAMLDRIDANLRTRLSRRGTSEAAAELRSR